MRNNQAHKENIDKKVQQRIKIQNKVLNKNATSIDSNKKEILQDNGKSLDDKYSIDYRKERAKLRNEVMENMRNRMKLIDGSRKGESDYHNMNNKLIKQNIFPDVPLEKLNL